MNTNTHHLITPHHLSRKAIIYVRQSTLNQVLTHQESQRLQYALAERARALGWAEEDIDIIDQDLGRSGGSIANREGFKELLSRVALSEVGLILAYEVTRLSRNCSDWYPLLDLCGYKNCLIADIDGIYDPGTPNGRLLLGLKGQLSELELHTIRSRLTAGLLSKARRGELALRLPVGLVRQGDDRVVKDPNREVQQRLNLLFSLFIKQGSASKVLRTFNKEQLRVPRRNRFGDLVWKRPSVAAILSILKNPAYAGAFVYGRTRTTRNSEGRPTTKRLPMDQWRIVVKDTYPAYINWSTFEKIQTMLRDNRAEYDRNKTRGIPREGAALLHGVVYCGQCGHKMVVQYKSSPRYICNYLRQQYQTPVCQYIPCPAVDARVIASFFEALSPLELDAYQAVLEQAEERATQIDLAHRQQLERMRYQEELARRQFDQVDPQNRLVAAELEQRWEAALRELRGAEERYQDQKQGTQTITLSPQLKEAYQALGTYLPALWDTISTPIKKAFLRTLIDKVVLHRSERDTIEARIVWKGDATTTMHIPIPVGSFAELSGAQEMEAQIIELSRQGLLDEVIAERLTESGFRSPTTEHVLPSTVKTVRLKHGILQKRSQSHPRQIEGYYSVPQLARLLKVSPHWFYDRINNRKIRIEKHATYNLYLFPESSQTLAQLRKLKRAEVDSVSFNKMDS